MIDKKPLKAAGTATDHLFRYSSQRSIQNISAAFSSLLDRSSQPMWLVGLDGVLLQANRAALAFGNTEAEQVVGHRLVETAGWRFFSQEQERLHAAIRTAANGQVSGYEADVRQSGKRHTSTQLTVELTVRPIMEPTVMEPTVMEPTEGLASSTGKKPLLLMIEGTDISALRQAESSLLRCQRLKSVDDLTVGLIHDFKDLLTPLSAIATLLQVEFPEADDSQRELFQILATNTHRANVLLRQMLSFIRRDSEKYVSVSVDYLIRDIQTLIRSTFPISISINTALPSGLWPVKVKENQVYQVLVNLCLNARDAMPEGGELKFSAENYTSGQSALSNGALSNGASSNGASSTGIADREEAIARYVVIQISDTGLGIPPKILNRVFDPFFTTKLSARGAGLSTAISIVTSHGGFIDVSSVENEGTQFRVFLPALG